MKKINEDIQNIGLDLGRGYVKGYTELNGRKIECLFKSVVGMGRSMDFENYKEPIYIEVADEDYFVGDLAEKEADVATANSKDDKTTLTAKKLFYAALNKLAVKSNVKIVLGVPNKLFRKCELDKITKCYKDKTIEIKDHLTGATKTITVNDITIYRESDAALMWCARNNFEIDKPCGMVTVGFRTTELSYFDKGLKYNNKKSKTIEIGNKTVLEYVQRKLADNNIMKELNEIDSNIGDYDKLKKIGYQNLAENVKQAIERDWINLDEMEIMIAGGTALNMDLSEYKIVENAQMVTAKGLWLIANKFFE